MGKLIKVRSKISPEHTATIEAERNLLMSEDLDMFDFVNGLIITTNWWGNTKYKIHRLTCPRCKAVHKDIEIKEESDWYYPYIRCTCDARLNLKFASFILECVVSELIIPAGYERIENESEKKVEIY